MSVATRRWLPALAIAAACTLPGRAARADDASPTVASSERDRAVAAVLESVNTRMKAKIEEASILDRTGRHDEALAALREVETIHREGLALVDRLAPPTPAPRTGPRNSPSPRIRFEPALQVAEAPSHHVVAAVSYLESAQRLDGWFRLGTVADAPPGADLDEGRDLHTTALAVLALLDSVTDDARQVAALAAAGRGVEALLGALDRSGAFGDAKDLEGHALATWAVAAGAARLPRATWRPAAPQAIAKAVAFSLASRDARGLWSAGTGSTDDDWILSAWMATSLHEAYVLPRSFVRDVDLGVVLNRVRLGAHEAWMSGVAATSPAARFARALLVEEASPEESGLLPRTAADEEALLLGTTLRFGRSFGFDAWQDEVLLPSQRSQRRDGAFSGSWNASGARALAHGRTYATACRLLAALVPVVPYREPEGD